MKLWTDILINPLTKELLILDEQKKLFTNIDSEVFTALIDDEIPIILPKTVDADKSKSHFHDKVQSQFDYLNHYQNDAETFDYFVEFDSPITNDEINRLHQKIISKIPQDAQVILDVGCGNGWLSKQLVNEYRKVISMDISLTNPRKARKNLDHPNHLGLVADVYHLPLKINSLDCIIASEIMEHVYNPKLFVQKLVEALKPGGKLIITTPYNENLVYHLCVHCNKPTPSNAHLHSFNEENIQQLIPNDIHFWKHSTFSNKYIAKLRLYLFIKNWPFKIWNAIDFQLNKIIKPATRLMIEITK